MDLGAQRQNSQKNPRPVDEVNLQAANFGDAAMTDTQRLPLLDKTVKIPTVSGANEVRAKKSTSEEHGRSKDEIFAAIRKGRFFVARRFGVKGEALVKIATQDTLTLKVVERFSLVK